jgi:glycosyltransferase involved in cell wall biosynthesis
MAEIKIVAIIPAKDEQATIGDILSRMPSYCTTIVVNDGSTDKTAEVALQHGALVVSHRKNQGVGAAFKTGLRAALSEGADIIVTLDADGQMDPQYIPHLIKPILDKKADVVIATRFKGNMSNMPMIKRIGNRFFTFMVNRITSNYFSDCQCGFRCYSRESAKKINIFGKFTYTQEVIMDLADKGQKIVEIPLPILAKRAHGKSKVVKNFVDYGIKASLIILKAARDYEPLKFFGLPGLFFTLIGGGMDAYALIQKIFFDVSLMEHNPWIVFFGSLILIFGVFCMVFALLADSFTRHRKMVEEILERMR